MVEKHLGKGDDFPPLNGKVRLYSMLFCPYAQRVRLVLSHKNVEFETVNINLQDKPEWFFRINPKGQVPVLDYFGEIVTESLDIAQFVEGKVRQPAILPSNDVGKELGLIESFDSMINLYYDAVRKRNAKSFKEHCMGLKPYLDKVEKELLHRGSFFGGENPNIVDFMIWPWAERYQVPSMVFNEDIPFKTSDFPSLTSWFKSMLDQKAVKECFITAERHFKATTIHLGRSLSYDEI